MKRLLISGFVAVALLAAATTMLRSRSYHSAAEAGLSQNSQFMTAVGTLPTQEFEDMSLVFSNKAKP
jgi:hypothetical protein